MAHKSLYLHSNKASLFYKVTSSMSTKCLAAPSGNPRLAYFDLIVEPIHNTSFLFDYIMVSVFYVVASMKILP